MKEAGEEAAKEASPIPEEIPVPEESLELTPEKVPEKIEDEILDDQYVKEFEGSDDLKAAAMPGDDKLVEQYGYPFGKFLNDWISFCVV